MFLQISYNLSNIIFLIFNSLVLANIVTYAYNDDLIVDDELLIAVDVNAHSNLTLYDDVLLEKSDTIFNSRGFCVESYLHFCFSIFNIDNCNMSPIYYTAWKFICCYRYFIAFYGLLLFNNKNAFLFVDRSVYFCNNY